MLTLVFAIRSGLTLIEAATYTEYCTRMAVSTIGRIADSITAMCSG